MNLNFDIMKRLALAPIDVFLRHKIIEGLGDQKEFIELPADDFSVIDVVALHELGFGLQNRLSIGEIRIQLKSPDPVGTEAKG